MARKIKTLPNQSLLDMILTEYGSLEAGIRVAAANNIPISYLPLVDTEIEIPTPADTDNEGIAYMRRNGITLGTMARTILSVETVLKPRIKAVSTATGNPHVLGYYSFDMVADAGFFSANPLAGVYTENNRLCYITEERHIANHPSQSSLPVYATPMTDITIPYKLPWTVGLGYMMVYSDLSQPIKTATFRDIEGNEAYTAPLTVLDNVSQNIIEHLSSNIIVEVVSATLSSVQIRLTRVHPTVMLADFANYEMQWLLSATEGNPDPEDAGNPDKTILTLGPGTYTIGAITTYYFTGYTPPHAYPSSSFSMVIRVY